MTLGIERWLFLFISCMFLTVVFLLLNSFKLKDETTENNKTIIFDKETWAWKDWHNLLRNLGTVLLFYFESIWGLHVKVILILLCKLHIMVGNTWIKKSYVHSWLCLLLSLLPVNRGIFIWKLEMMFTLYIVEVQTT